MIGFGYAGDATEPDGARVFLDEARLDGSLNAGQLTSGNAYPALYATLPAQLRAHCAELSRGARKPSQLGGLWPRSTGAANGPATVLSLPALEGLVMWPKLFRRVVPYLAGGFLDFDGLDGWLRADPVHRDALFLLDRLEHGNLHDVVLGAGPTIQLTAWPEDFIIEPDPPAPGPRRPNRPTVALGDVLIIAALPDPIGSDAGAETVTLINASAATVDLANWTLADAAGGRQSLTGALRPGVARSVQLTSAIQLRNQGDTIGLADAQGQIIDRVAYQANQARPGRTICFGR